MRRACMVASVPELENRTMSTPVIRMIRSAARISHSVVAAKITPSRMAWLTRSTTVEWPCPRITGP